MKRFLKNHPKKLRICFLCLAFASSLILLIVYIKKVEKAKSPSNIDYVNEQKQVTALRGTIKTGDELNISFCKNGLYLQTDDNRKILIHMNDDAYGAYLFNDKNWVDKKVSIEGIYPAGKDLCEDDVCECEDYLIAKTIKAVLVP